ncbi:MAG: cupin domain-containing protein [Fermentimonas sp.]|jgi:mannose-6-phosphate isomerase-like protein (cupin superfamily)
MKHSVLVITLILSFVLSACNNGGTQKDLVVDKEYENNGKKVEFKDFGPAPFVFDVEDYTLQNETFRTAIWTGEHMQMTVMSIPAGGEIGLEMHPDIDQFLRIESGSGIVYLGDAEDNFTIKERVGDDFGIFIPAGKWHNLVNDSDEPIKLYSIYAPVEHPHGTVHRTAEEAIEAHQEAHGN